jgi:anaerobic selenocysteine-containing dehydrogenase
MVDYHPLRRCFGSRKQHDRVLASVCQECAVGCGLVAYIDEDRIVDVQGDETNPISRGRLCSRGSLFPRLLYSADRISKPMARTRIAEEFRECDDWDQALDLVSDRLKRIRDQHGPEALLIGCDPRAGADFLYAGMRFAALWGTPHLFDPFGQHAHAFSAEVASSPDAPCSDWVHAGCLFLVGADPAATHPVVTNWILDAQDRGTKVVVADTRFTATMSKADVALRIRPESGNALGMALMQLLLDRELHSVDCVENQFIDPDAWKASFDRMSFQDAAEITGLSPEQIANAALLVAAKGPVQLITGRPLAHLPGYGIWRTMAGAMGWTGKPGGGWYPLDSGRPSLNAASGIEDRKEERTLNSVADPHSSLNQLLGKGLEDTPSRVKAVICSEHCFDESLHAAAKDSKTLELAASFGSLLSQERNWSHFIFPASLWAERDGLVFTNDSGVRWARRIAEPLSGTRSGLDFWMGLASRFGWEAHFPWVAQDGSADHRAFAEWLLQQNPLTEACVPAVWEDSEDAEPTVYWSMEASGREKMQPVHALVSVDASQGDDADRESYPLRLESPHLGSRCTDLANLWPWSCDRQRSPLLQINPEVATALGIESGDAIIALAAGLYTEARAWVSRAVPRSVVYSTHMLGVRRVLVHRKGQTSQEALHALRGMLP